MGFDTEILSVLKVFFLAACWVIASKNTVPQQNKRNTFSFVEECFYSYPRFSDILIIIEST
jgi:hypothetical protein